MQTKSTASTAKVVSIQGNKVILDHSPFHFRGGGQPADHGSIGSAAVVDVVREQGKLIHILAENPLFHAGDTVELVLDVERRMKLTKMHTAQHLLFKALEEIVGAEHISVGKVDLDPDESSLFVTGEITLTDVLKAEKRVLEIIKENRSVKEHLLSKREVMEKQKQFPGLRIKLDRIEEEPVRIIEVAGWDYSACCGTHVSHTAEIGGFFVVCLLSAGKKMFEIRFRLDAVQLYSFADLGRFLKDELAVDVNDVLSVVRNLRAENTELKKKVRVLGAQIIVEPTVEELHGVSFVSCVYPGMEKKEFLDKLTLLKIKYGTHAVICLLNENSRGYTFLLSVSIDLFSRFTARTLLDAIKKSTPLQGGGRDELVMGSCGKDVRDVLKKELGEKTYFCDSL